MLLIGRPVRFISKHFQRTGICQDPNMMQTEVFTFWHLQNKKLQETCLWIDPTSTLEEMKSDWLTRCEIQLHPSLYPYSFVYDGIILEDGATLSG